MRIMSLGDGAEQAAADILPSSLLYVYKPDRHLLVHKERPSCFVTMV
jgi:hypothetical protein